MKQLSNRKGMSRLRKTSEGLTYKNYQINIMPYRMKRSFMCCKRLSKSSRTIKLEREFIAACEFNKHNYLMIVQSSEILSA